MLASQFGASADLDIYYSAFKIPDLIFNLFILGAVSSAFIPVFIEHYQEDKQRAWRLAQNFLNVAFAVILAVSFVMLIFARPAAYIIAPGFSEADMELLVQLLRIMLISPIIFAWSTIMGSVLQALQRFIAYAIAPILYNVGIIFGALYIVPFMRVRGYEEVFGLGAGVVLGAILHLLVQLPASILAGFRFSNVFDLADQGLRKIIRLMIPRTLGIGAYSIDSTVTNAIASTLGTGSITVFNFANNIQFVPISVLGISIATAVFPQLSSHASADENHQFRHRLSQALGRTFFIVGISAVLIYVFREWIIKMIYGVGIFQGANIDITAQILGIFMFGVVGQSLVPIMSRAFYALQNTKTPVIVAVISILLNIGLGLLFTFRFHMGIEGLAWALAISGNVNFLLLYGLFQRKYS